MRMRSLAVAAALSLAPGLSAAQQLAPGSFELTPTVSFSHSSFKREGYGRVDNFTEFNVTPTIGYCLTHHFEATGGVMVRHRAQNGSGDTALGLTAGMIYNFAPQGGVIPYASLGFGTLFYDGFSFQRTAVLAPMISGGVRVLVGNSGAVNMSLGYQHESNAEGEYQMSASRMLASVGLSLFPWRVK